jgi:hypothetical protein
MADGFGYDELIEDLESMGADPEGAENDADKDKEKLTKVVQGVKAKVNASEDEAKVATMQADFYKKYGGNEAVNDLADVFMAGIESPTQMQAAIDKVVARAQKLGAIKVEGDAGTTPDDDETTAGALTPPVDNSQGIPDTEGVKLDKQLRSGKTSAVDAFKTFLEAEPEKDEDSKIKLPL